MTTPATSAELAAAIARAHQIGDPLHAELANWLGCLFSLDPTDQGGPECGWCGQDHATLIARRVLGETTTDARAQPAGLRDRIRRAVCEASGFTWLPDELMEPDEYGEHADAVLAVLPAPTDRAAILRELEARYRGNARDSVHPTLGAAYAAVANDLRRLADEAQQPAPAVTDALTDCATEYRVPVPENGGEQLLVRRQSVAQGAGWAVSVMARGGGRAWTTEGWQESISALSVDRLFCWPDARTAVDEARRALAAPAVTEEPTR